MRTLFSLAVWIYWSFCIILCFLGVALVYLLTFPFDRFNTLPNYLVGWLARAMLTINPGWEITINGADASKIQQPTLVVANHQSFLDMPLLYLLPWNMKWVAKKSLFQIPIFGWMIYMTGHIGIDRKNRASVKKLDKLVQPIQEGIPGMIFPEGTRSPSGQLKTFKNGAFTLARRYNFNVLPIVIEGSGSAMPAGSWKIKPLQDFSINVLDPISVNEFSSANELKNHTYNTIEQVLMSSETKTVH